MVSPFDEEMAIFSVSQVASMLGVQAAFVRRLDTEQVITPTRSDGGHRRYSHAEVQQVQRVAELAGEGLSLAGVRRVLELEAEVAELRRQVAALQSGQRQRQSTSEA